MTAVTAPSLVKTRSREKVSGPDGNGTEPPPSSLDAELPADVAMPPLPEDLQIRENLSLPAQLLEEMESNIREDMAFLMPPSLQAPLLTAEEEQEIGKELGVLRLTIEKRLYALPLARQWTLSRLQYYLGYKEDEGLFEAIKAVEATLPRPGQEWTRIPSPQEAPEELRATINSALDVITRKSRTPRLGLVSAMLDTVLENSASLAAIEQREKNGDCVRQEIAAWEEQNMISASEARERFSVIIECHIRRKEVRNKLLPPNGGLVGSRVKRELICKPGARQVGWHDLLQEGRIALLHAADWWEPGRGCKFSSYAYFWVRQGVLRAIATEAGTIALNEDVISQITALRRAEIAINDTSGWGAEDEEICGIMELGPEELEKIRSIRRAKRVLSLDRPIKRRKSPEAETLKEWISDDICQPAEATESVYEARFMERLARRVLTEKEFRAIQLHFGAFATSPDAPAEVIRDGMSFEDAGALMGYTHERVRQFEAKGLPALKAFMLLSEVPRKKLVEAMRADLGELECELIEGALYAEHFPCPQLLEKFTALEQTEKHRTWLKSLEDRFKDYLRSVAQKMVDLLSERRPDLVDPIVASSPIDTSIQLRTRISKQLRKKALALEKAELETL